MDILYVVGTGSIWQNNELRYSLRSIAQNGINVGRVFLVGYKPKFVSDDVTHIPCSDPYDQPHKNILYKVITAIESGELGRHFLISSDDHFYIKPTDFNKVPVYHKGMLPEKIPFDKQPTFYWQSLIETRNILLRHGLTTWQTNPHCNTHFDVDVYEQNKAIFGECFTTPSGGELNCIMGNLLIKGGAEPVRFHDSKVANKYNIDAKFAERIQDANCVSGVPAIGGSYLADWLIHNFSQKSRYEK